MKDVAERCGVSVATVSHVYNKTRFVSKDVVKRVNRAIEELNYYPSAVAQSLKSNQTRTIGVMIPNNSNPFFADLIRGVEDTCYEQNYNVILCNTDDNKKKQIKYLQVLIAKQVDGLIVVATDSEERLANLLSKQSIPVSIIDREVAGLQADYFRSDNELGGYLATRHLIELGHEKIGCISGPPDLNTSIKREVGFNRAMREAKLEVNPRWVIAGYFKSKGGYESMKKILALDQRPTAIIACNDLMAIGSLCAAYEYQLKVPDDISIVGYDDILLASYSCPPLTTIMQLKHELGVMAAQALLEHIKNKNLPKQNTLLEPRLIIRDSTSKP
ncbi:MAG: LacI family transcriptional regulator [Desulfobacterales bacterium]|nr:LacI family transcriptional regulator [Desulfobacterales bacterium]